jgi:Carboxypeptidase regulatory-like domain
MRLGWVLGLWAAPLLLPIGFQAPAQQATPVSQAQSSSSAKSGNQKYSHAHDFLIRGTVFTDKALSFPGVQLRIRRAGEKKFRWEDSTNSRGEFAIRVPQGTQYEMVVRAKGFAEQARTIDARNGSGENNIVFRMEPAKKGKQ